MAYINSDDFLELCYVAFAGQDKKFINTVETVVENTPTAEVVEVRYGEWIPASKKQGVNCGMKCSICGARIKYSEFFNGNHNYCHKCGAKMYRKDGE